MKISSGGETGFLQKFGPAKIFRYTVDFKHLLRDLPKYKPWLSAIAWKAWEEFHTTTDKLSEVCLYPWELPKLVSDAIIAGRARKESTGASVSSEARAVLDKETATSAKVLY